MEQVLGCIQQFPGELIDENLSFYGVAESPDLYDETSLDIFNERNVLKWRRNLLIQTRNRNENV